MDDESQRSSWWRLHTVAAAALVIAVAIAALAGTGAGRMVRDNDRRLLLQQTAEAQLVLGSLMSQSESALGALGTAVAVTGASPEAFAATAAPMVGDRGYAALALLRVDGPVITRLAGAGSPLLATSSPDLAAAVARAAAGDGYALTGFVGTGAARRMGTVLTAPRLPAGLVIYAESAMGPGETTANVDGLAFQDIDFAVYLGLEQGDRLVFSSTTDLPLRGERAVGVVRPGDLDSPKPVLGEAAGVGAVEPGELIMVLRPRAHLSGAIAGWLPWIAAALILLAGAAVAALLEATLRRRDHALQLVTILEAQHEELDRALADERRGQEERARLEDELRQAQRMEAVGQLAGGIAHDFNNLLAVILACSGFVADEVGDGPLGEDVEEIRRAARRAAELTRQLLVFSRRDVVEPAVIDLNAVVVNTERLLRRTIGEHIELVTDLEPGTCAVLADRGELEQVLMNLAVNARDAMDDGGRLTISTAAVDCRSGVDAVDGVRCVQLVVRDTGAGMSREVAQRAFEPFFTTKGPGRGTGLGLATVYGIATRWGGHVSVTSAPGEGTSVVVELPLSPDAPGVVTVPAQARPAATGAGRRVLLVEDEAAVRRVTRRALERAGYDVVEASDGPSALAAYDERVAAVVTDVIMPGGSDGRAVVTALRERRPGLPVVFMSGYNADTLGTRGVLDEGVVLVQKPFTDEQLLDRLQDVLTVTEVVAADRVTA